MSEQPMKDLPEGAVFDKFTGGARHTTRYQVVRPASDLDDREVEVRNLSMTDAEAANLLATPGGVEVGCDPRDGVFTTGQIEAPVEVIV